MDLETQRALGAINRRFYSARAEEFSATREHAWPGWERVLAAIPRSSASPSQPLRVLDLGCGNGRFARFLRMRCQASLEYHGIDESRGLLEIAECAMAGTGGSWRFDRLDLCEPAVEHALPQQSFDLVSLFGLLHHLPGFSTRRAVVAAACARLAPGGLLAATLWRLDRDERVASRILSWSRYNASAPEPIDESRLEPGDCLLPWGSSDGPPRYCHLIDAAEAARLFAGLPLAAVDSFDSDGPHDRSNRYHVFRSSSTEPTH